MASNLNASAPKHRYRRVLRLCACFLWTIAILLIGIPADGPRAADAMTARIKALAPELESYIANGMTAFDNPGLAIGIVTEEGLVYAKGFGVRRKGGPAVDPETVFQIGSTTKAFLR